MTKNKELPSMVDKITQEEQRKAMIHSAEQIVLQKGNCSGVLCYEKMVSVCPCATEDGRCRANEGTYKVARGYLKENLKILDKVQFLLKSIRVSVNHLLWRVK